MVTEVFITHFQPIVANIDKMAKWSLQATFKWMFAVFCNILPKLFDIWTKSSLQPTHWFIYLVYSLQKPSENPSMENYEHPVMKPQLEAKKREANVSDLVLHKSPLSQSSSWHKSCLSQISRDTRLAYHRYCMTKVLFYTKQIKGKTRLSQVPIITSIIFFSFVDK